MFLYKQFDHVEHCDIVCKSNKPRNIFFQRKGDNYNVRSELQTSQAAEE